MSLMTSTKSFLLKCKRVWTVLKKPSKDEFWMTAKVSGAGIALLGVVGFLISIVIKLFI